MAQAKRTRTADILGTITARGFNRIGEPEWNELRTAFPDTSETTLRHAVRQCGVELDPLVDGVRLSEFDQFERSLGALIAEHDRACREGDSDRAQRCRQVAIAAKDHAKMAGRVARDPDRSAQKAEMVAWLLVWLETPDLFASWVDLRRRARRSVDAVDRL